MIISIIAFIVIFSVLILVHEWGHFAAARRAGIKVEEFGLGIPPKAKQIHKDKKGTIYTLNWIPFGGFVRLYGEDSADPKVLKDKKSFASKTIAQRSLVVVAGVLMNFALAWVLITIGFTVGMKPFLATQEDVENAVESGVVSVEDAFLVHEIDDKAPLSTTALQAGDFITALNGIEVSQDTDLERLILPNTKVRLNYIHEQEEGEMEVVSSDAGKLGMTISLERRIVDIQSIRYPFYEAPIKAVGEIVRLSVLTVKMLGNVITTIVGKFAVPETVAGPLGIAKMTSVFAKQGLMALVQFTALLSISLGVINIMPFPALDGGRFLFILFELIFRKKPNAKMEAIIHTVGFGLLMLLILFITWNDIIHLFE